MKQFTLNKWLLPGFIAVTLLNIALPAWSHPTSQDNSPTTSATLKKTVVNNLEGTLEIRGVTLPKDNVSPIQYLLRQANGKIYYLHFSDHAPTNLKTGAQIKIRHAVMIPMTNGFNQLEIISNDLIVTKDVSASAIPDSFGPQKTIVFLLNFQDQPNNKPWTTNDVQSLVFNTVNNMYFETSYKQTTIVGNVIGWYTVALNTNMDCNTMTNAIPGLAETAATQAGVDLSSYTRRVYMFPINNTCGYAGLGTVGRNGAYSQAWLNGYNDLRITSHELGHNVGLWHSHFLQCPGSSTEGNCTQIEYGDTTDVMGGGYGTHFTAYQKERLGWLNYGTSPAIQTATTSGQYVIYPFETKGANPASDIKALKILKKVLPNGTSDYYYLEFRQGIGFDTPLASCGNSCDFTRGVVFHSGNSNDSNSSNLLDMSPLDNNTNLVSLLPGQTFSDPNAPNGGVKIKTESVNSNGAIVTVTFGSNPPPCVRTPFTMTLSPTQTIPAGSSTNYSLTITNNDTAACGPSSFKLFSSPAPAWIKATLATLFVTVNGQSSAVINITAKTSLAAPRGIYTIDIAGTNTTPPMSFGSARTSLIVR